MEISNFFSVATAESFSRCHIHNKVDRPDTGVLFLSRSLPASRPEINKIVSPIGASGPSDEIVLKIIVLILN